MNFPRSKLRAGLVAARSNFAIFRLTIPELRDHVVVEIEDAYLAVQIGANHPLALSMKIARHT